jgi:glycosyltransferase involved in cell wall biosynthesis
MRAFATAFPNTTHTRLIFKTHRSAEYPHQHESLQALARDLNISDRFTSIDGYLSNQDIYCLTATCDVYLSLHRGEGFGLCVAEAMSFGRPVVVSDYASTAEFCNSDTALLIPATRIPYPDPQRDHPYYLSVTECAEPDIDAAAAALRRCYEDSAHCTAIGLKGKTFVEEHFSTANFKQSVEAFLNG